MKRYLLSILTDPIEKEIHDNLQPEETKITTGWMETGILLSLYFRADAKGLFAVMQGNNEQDIKEYMKQLPLYPYMHITITELK
jgi:muconolactone delta-isomerase